METRASFVLIGAFAIAGLLGILGFFLWFAQVELDRQFSYYDIYFPTVSGLSNASDVRFSGLPVGQVVDVRLSPNRDGTILVRVEVNADTPVRKDSIATIESQGVTGVSYVGIDPGTPQAAILEPTVEQPVPVIEAGRSTLQSLSEDAPQLLERALAVVDEIGQIFDQKNTDRVNNILENVEVASEKFAKSLEDFSTVTGSVSEFAEQIGTFNETFDTLSRDLTGVLKTADTALTSLAEMSEQGKGVLTATSKAVTSAQSAISRTETFIDEDLVPTTTVLRETSSEVRRQLGTLSTSATEVMDTFKLTGETATARLDEAQETIATANALIARLDTVATSVGDTTALVDTVIREEGRPLLKETRTMVAEANKAVTAVTVIAQEDLPVVMADIRTATATASKTITDVGNSLKSSSEGVEALIAKASSTLDDATVAFNNANVTLEAIDSAMLSAEDALAIAETTFTNANTIITEDMDGIIEGLNATLASLQEAIAQVSEDIPGITADLRAASRSATATFADIRRVTNASAPAVQDFTTTALPLFTRLAQESRTLVGNLDRLTTTFQRNPARFLLDRDTPEFKR